MNIPDALPAVLGIVFMAGLIQGLAGFGAGLVAVPLLALLMPVATVVPLMVLLGIAISLLNLLHLHHVLRHAPVARLLLGYLLGSPLGLLFLRHAPQSLVLGILGLFVSGYALFSLAGRQPRAAWLRDWRVGLGMVSGALGAAFSIGGPPIVLHVTAHEEWSADLRKATMTLFFLLAGLLTLVTHAVGGLVTAEVLSWLLWSGPVLVLGTFTGIGLYRRLGEHNYARLTFLLILATGSLLVVRSVVSLIGS